MKRTVKYNDNDNNSVVRIWQRLIHAKSIRIFCYKIPESNLLLNKLCSMRNVEIVEGSLHSLDANFASLMARAIMSRSKETIKECNIALEEGVKDMKFSPLLLPNAEKIWISDLNFN